MTTEHEHDWAVSQHAGFGCRVCDASYWDWSRAELQRLPDLLAHLDDARALGDRLWRDVEALQRERTELLGQVARLMASRDDWKRGAEEEARAGDEAREQLHAAKKEADLNRNLATASAAVVEAAREVDGSAHGFDGVKQFAAWRRLNIALAALDRAPSESVQ